MQIIEKFILIMFSSEHPGSIHHCLFHVTMKGSAPHRPSEPLTVFRLPPFDEPTLPTLGGTAPFRSCLESEMVEIYGQPKAAAGSRNWYERVL
jgi:hypothetical protein